MKHCIFSGLIVLCFLELFTKKYNVKLFEFQHLKYMYKNNTKLSFSTLKVHV